MSDLKKEMLKIKVKGYFDNGDLRIDPTITALVKYHVDKARHNIETGSLLMYFSKDKYSKKRLKVSADYIGYDWTIGCGYYAMFHAATAALAAIGIKAQSHESLIEGEVTFPPAEEEEKFVRTTISSFLSIHLAVLKITAPGPTSTSKRWIVAVTRS